MGGRGSRTADPGRGLGRSTHRRGSSSAEPAESPVGGSVGGGLVQQTPALLTLHRAEEDTHLEHDFIDGRRVRFKVEVLIVVIA